MMNDAYAKAETILTEHMSKLHEVAKTLFMQEKLSGEEFASLMEKPVEPVLTETSESTQTSERETKEADTVDAQPSAEPETAKTEEPVQPEASDDDTPTAQE